LVIVHEDEDEDDLEGGWIKFSSAQLLAGRHDDAVSIHPILALGRFGSSVHWTRTKKKVVGSIHCIYRGSPGVMA